MKQPVILGSLILANLLFLAWLIGGLAHQSKLRAKPFSPDVTATAAAMVASIITNVPDPSRATGSVTQSEKSPASATPFAHVYSPDPKQFAANLRAIGCPEETIKDILTAEVHRWYQPQEQALRPTPADHVPFAWSARTSEPKLIERRQQAAALARDESALLHNALSCEITVPMPLYAMTISDQQFEATFAGSANACAIRDVQDTYWAGVHTLQQRIKDFWLPEDVAELYKLKAQRRQALSGLLPGQ